MGKALYRSHRPRSLAEVVGQEHVTTTLARALEKGTISHAYLFIGPRGVGKTSIARILAHEVNGLAYDEDATNLDIIEIDAASNRRIDEIRDLRDKVHIAPTSSKYKVYIIDEVHMLTREAFNALLKTLEEPPAHVIFILATTEAHKLPETIISRTQRFSFKPVEFEKIVAHLKTIAASEKIDIADDALQLIAVHGEGSFRDSISLLDQARNAGHKVTLADVQGMLGMPPATLVEALVEALGAHDAAAVAKQLQQLSSQGYEPAQTAKQVGQALRARLLEKQPPLPPATLLTLLGQLVEVPASSDPRIKLEIALLDTALSGQPAPPPPKPTVTTKPPKVMSEQVQGTPPAEIEPHPSTYNKPAKAQTTPEPAPTTGETVDAAIWPNVLAAIKKHHNTLYGIIRTARPHFEPGKLTLELDFAFHQKRVSDNNNQKILADTVLELGGQPVQIVCTVGKAAKAQPAPPALPPTDEKIHTAKTPEKPAEKDQLSTISNIFGAAELLES